MPFDALGAIVIRQEFGQLLFTKDLRLIYISEGFKVSAFRKKINYRIRFKCGSYQIWPFRMVNDQWPKTQLGYCCELLMIMLDFILKRV